jgi:phage head maturation protease
MMRSMRGLYVIRGGAAVPRLAGARPSRADEPAGDAAQDGRLGTLEVDFSRFDTWYEIDSFWEGRFLERVQRGAFKRSISAHWRAAKGGGGDTVKVLFNHGFDMFLDNKSISVPEVLEEREEFAHLEGPLFRGVPELIVEGLRNHAYGSSFMFEVQADAWNHDPEKTDDNPDALPERTITQVRLFEAGPVTWPANPEATAGLRSGMDWYGEQLERRDPGQYEELVRSFTAFRAYHGLRTSLDSEPATPKVGPGPKTQAPGTEPASHVDGVSAAARRRRLTLIDMARR